MKRKLFRISSRVLLVFLLAFFGSSLEAQVTYISSPVALNAGNPGGTTFAETTTTPWTQIPGLPGGISANAWSTPVTLPFAFNFYGTPVTDYVVSANGLLTFTSTVTGTPPNANGPLPDASLPDNTIAVLWDEFTNAPPIGTNDVVYYQTFGTAPNRQYWVYWFSYEYGNPNQAFQYSAAVLEETSNKVYVVDLYGTTPALSATVGVQKNATTAVMFGSNVAQYANGTTNPDNDYYEFTPILLVNDNAGVFSIDAPTSPLTVGTQNVDVTIKNYGLNTLDSVMVNWSVNGSVQTPFNYVGPLASDATASVTLGSYNFLAGTSDIYAWTSMPNGLSDADVSNDSSMVSLCTSLSGAYTIGGVGADYADVNAAIGQLNSCGISGPVTFNIAAGTYTGPYVINEVAGASGVNTITFDGGSAAATILTHTGAGQYSTVQLNGADHITFQNLTVQNTGTANAWGVHLWNQADSNTINNCIIDMDITATGTTIAGVVATNSATSVSTVGNNANYTTVSNTIFNGAYYGVRFYGNVAAATDQTNNSVINCTFNNVYAYGMFFYYQDNPIAIGNRVNGTRSTTGYGVNFSNSRHGVITGNTILDMNTYAIYMLTVNGTAQTHSQRALIANNMATAIGTGDALYMTGSSNVDVFYNSFTAVNDQALWLSTTATNYNIRNNIFVASGTSQVVDLDATPTASTGILDYNIYNHSGGGDIAIVGTTTYTTLAAWQTGDPAQNVNSLAGDPTFTGATDLHLVGTLADGVASPIAAITLDIDGDPRSATTPDIGADEYTPPSCSPPTALSITASAFYGVASWTSSGGSAWDVEYGPLGFTPGTGTFHLALAITSDTLSGLNPTTSYEYYVREKCGGVNSPWVGPVSFTTTCAPYIPTYVEDFTTWTSASNLQICWAEYDGQTPATIGAASPNTASGWIYDGFGNNAASPYSVTASTGSASIELYNTGDNDWLVSPEFDLTGVPFQLDYNWLITNWSSTASERIQGDDFVALMMTTDAGATWNELLRYDSSTVVFASLLGEFEAIDLSAYSGSIVQFGFWGSEATADDPGDIKFFMDNFRVRPIPSCPEATSLTGTPIYNGVDFDVQLSWSTNGVPSDFLVEYGPLGFTPGTGTLDTVVLDTFLIVSGGFAPLSDYAFYVRRVCAVGDSSSWMGPKTFTTPCAPYLPTYLQQFSTWTSATNLPACWNEYDGQTPATVGGAAPNTASGWIYDGFGNNAASPFSVTASTGSASIELYNTGDNDWLVSPEINLTSGGPYQLDYNWLITNWSSTASEQIQGDDFVAVLISTNSGATWTELTRYDSSTVVFASLLGEYEVIDLTAYSGNIVQFGFWGSEAVADDPGDIKFFMDNFRVRPIPTCPEASAISANFIGFDQVLLSWTEGGTASQWLLEYGAPGFTPGTGTSVLVGSNPASITGLMAETSYDVYVRAFCAAGDTSDYSFAYTVTTLCAPVAAPVLETFESVAVAAFGDLGNCWSTSPTTGYRWESENSTGLNENTAGTGPFFDHTLNPVAGGIYMYTESTSGAVNDTAYLNSPLMDLSAMTFPRVSYWYHMYGAGTGDLLLQINDGTGWTSISTVSGQQQMAGSDDWINVKANVFDYVGDTVAFRFIGVKGSGTSDISLDDVALEEAPATDVAVVNVSSPAQACGSMNSPITVTVENLGGADQVFIPLLVDLSGAVSGSYNLVIPFIAAGTSVEVTLDSINTLVGGTVSITAFTALATDEVPANDSYSTTVEVGAVPMSLPIVDQSVCEGASAQFVNTSSSNARWILAANDSVVLVGDTFSVAPTMSTAYQLELFNLSTENLGEIVPPTTSFVSPANLYGLRFNANSDFILNSFTVYPTGTGNITIGLYDESTYTLVDQMTVAVSDGGTALTPFVVNLDWEIPASVTPYRMVYVGGLGVTTLGRSTTGISFPYATSNGEVEIYNSSTSATTGSTTSSYYYFYDWNVSLPGCPSERTAFNVNVVPSTSDTLAVTACDAVMIAGNSETVSGFYPETFTSVATGCDSMVVFDLTILNSTSSSLSADVCFGADYTLPDGTIVDTAGTYVATLTNAAGCDSVITVTVNELLPASSSMNASFCAGSSYTLPSGATVSAAGTYNDVLVGMAANGCDSIVSVTLTEIAAVTSSMSVDVCDGSSYTLPDGVVVSTAGTYTSTVAAASGCDSIITTTVSLVNTFNIVQNVQICANDTLFVGSSAYTATGSYVDVLTSSGGCDSVVTSNLVVFAAIDVTIGGVSVVCDNVGVINLDLDPVGGVLSGDGVTGSSFDPAAAGLGAHLITYTFTDVNGCAAMASLNVEVVVCTGIENLEGIETVSIYPNPFLSTINIMFDDASAGELNIKLFDLTGSLILSEVFNTSLGMNNLKLEVPSQVAAGVTIMQIERNGEVYNTTLLKK